MKLLSTISYETPEGTFEGTIISGVILDDVKNGQQRENLRLTVMVDPLPDDPFHEYRVRIDYYGNKENQLLTDLYRILGGDVVELTDAEGNILPEKLKLLEGTRVKFDVTHEPHSHYKTPFRKAKNMRPLKEAA